MKAFLFLQKDLAGITAKSELLVNSELENTFCNCNLFEKQISPKKKAKPPLVLNIA